MDASKKNQSWPFWHKRPFVYLTLNLPFSNFSSASFHFFGVIKTVNNFFHFITCLLTGKERENPRGPENPSIH